MSEIQIVIGSFCLGVFATIVFVVDSNTAIISRDFKCSKYDMVGEAPNRVEECVVYTLEASHD